MIASSTATFLRRAVCVGALVCLLASALVAAPLPQLFVQTNVEWRSAVPQEHSAPHARFKGRVIPFAEAKERITAPTLVLALYQDGRLALLWMNVDYDPATQAFALETSEGGTVDVGTWHEASGVLTVAYRFGFGYTPGRQAAMPDQRQSDQRYSHPAIKSDWTLTRDASGAITAIEAHFPREKAESRLTPLNKLTNPDEYEVFAVGGFTERAKWDRKHQPKPAAPSKPATPAKPDTSSPSPAAKS
jgi:hypothetical protein